MLTIDGSYGEAGGQVLRTAVALSALTKTPCTITNIRASRPTPGLKPQHLMGLKAAADICQAATKGVTIGSKTVEFTPREIKSGEYMVSIGTAGSITLILQILTPICLHADDIVTVTVTGGTDVKWSPSLCYFQKVFCSLLKKMGARIEVTVKTYGFYPKGGGRVTAVIHPWKHKTPLHLTERGSLARVEVDSIASTFLQNAQVAERQSQAFQNAFSHPPVVTTQYVTTLNPGSSFCAVAYYDNTILGADALGEKRKPAEKVGQEAAAALTQEMESGAALDVHMADQIIPYLALIGGKISVSRVSAHTKTNMWVCQQFLDTALSVEQNIITAAL